MDLEQLASHIKSPVNLGSPHLEDTKTLVEKYPYASTVHILRLKTLANANHIDFEDELKLAAAHVSDREQLFYLINETIAPEVILDDSVEIESIANSEAQIEVLREKEVELKETQPAEIDITENAAEGINNDVTSETIEENEDLSSLDEEIMSHVVSVAFEKAADKLIPEKEQPTSHLQIEEEKTEVNSIVKNEIKTEDIDTSDLSFVEWLQLKQTQKPSSSTSHSDEKTTNKTEEPPLKEVIKSEDKKMSKKEINALLDRFIEEQPSITRPQKEFFSPTENAKQSLEESGEIVSETLAQIHVMQGNYKKAISAYKQLSLLYPEKKTFFASQIEKIKDKTG